MLDIDSEHLPGLLRALWSLFVGSGLPALLDLDTACFLDFWHKLTHIWYVFGLFFMIDFGSLLRPQISSFVAPPAFDPINRFVHPELSLLQVLLALVVDMPKNR
jgi:hypothetical protein